MAEIKDLKPFRKHDERVITVTIDEDGDALFLKTNVNDAFLELGEVVTQRASHVEPAPLYERVAFHTLRAIFGDKGRVSDWTRSWETLWRVNTKQTAGVILKGVWANREDAIATEIEFLNDWFLRGSLAIQEQQRQTCRGC